jgi:hypothetical protein
MQDSDAGRKRSMKTREMLSLPAATAREVLARNKQAGQDFFSVAAGQEETLVFPGLEAITAANVLLAPRKPSVCRNGYTARRIKWRTATLRQERAWRRMGDERVIISGSKSTRRRPQFVSVVVNSSEYNANE